MVARESVKYIGIKVYRMWIFFFFLVGPDANFLRVNGALGPMMNENYWRVCGFALDNFYVY